MATRYSWSGTLELPGLSVPIHLKNAISEKATSFSQFTADGHPVGRQAYDKETGEILSASEVLRARKADDVLVFVSDAELADLAADRSTSITVRQIVSTATIPLIQYQGGTYYIAAQDGSERALALLIETLGSGRSMLGTVVLRHAEKLLALSVHGSSLIASVLRYAPEITPAPPQDLPQTWEHKERHVQALAEALTPLIASTFVAEDHQNDYANAIEALIALKASGLSPEIIATEDRTQIPF